MATDGKRGGLQPTAEECSDLIFFAVLKDKVEYLIAQTEDTLATNPTSTSALRKRSKNLVKAWIELKAHYDRLCTIAGRSGWLQDQLQSSPGLAPEAIATLQRRYLEVHERAEAALKEAIKAAHEKANEAKTGPKNSGMKPSVEEEQAKEAALKKVVFYGQKIAAWERSIQAIADSKSAEIKAALRKDAIYEQKIAAWK